MCVAKQKLVGNLKVNMARTSYILYLCYSCALLVKVTFLTIFFQPGLPARDQETEGEGGETDDRPVSRQARNDLPARATGRDEHWGQVHDHLGKGIATPPYQSIFVILWNTGRIIHHICSAFGETGSVFSFLLLWSKHVFCCFDVKQHYLYCPFNPLMLMELLCTEICSFSRICI